jgi:hypothetical protein
MKKIELIYFEGCPSVLTAKNALNAAGIIYSEVIRDVLPANDPRRNYSSPTLLVDGKPVLGCSAQGDSCSIGQWDSEKTSEVLSSLKSKFGCRSI